MRPIVLGPRMVVALLATAIGGAVSSPVSAQQPQPGQSVRTAPPPAKPAPTASGPTTRRDQALPRVAQCAHLGCPGYYIVGVGY